MMTDVELVAIEDLELMSGGQSRVLRAGQRVRLPLKTAQRLVADAPEAVAAIPSIKRGTLIKWLALDKVVRGPSVALDSFVDLINGRTWLLVNWHGALHLIADREVCGIPSRQKELMIHLLKG